MAGVKGDFEKLEQAISKLRGVRAGLMPVIRQGLAAEAHSLMIEGFDAEEDPYGRKWTQSLRAKMEGGRTLSNTSTGLRNSFKASATDRGVELVTDKVYAATHQYGATIRAKTSKGLWFRSLVKRGKRAKAEGRWITKQQVTIPRRQYLPESDTGGLGPKWTQAFNEAAENIIDGHFED